MHQRPIASVHTLLTLSLGPSSLAPAGNRTLRVSAGLDKPTYPGSRSHSQIKGHAVYPLLRVGVR